MNYTSEPYLETIRDAKFALNSTNFTESLV
jgi:hypothetical protein